MPQKSILQKVMSGGVLKPLLRVSLPLLMVSFFLEKQIPFWWPSLRNQTSYMRSKRDLKQQLREIGNDSSYKMFLKSYQNYKLYRDSTIQIDTVTVMEYYLHNTREQAILKDN